MCLMLYLAADQPLEMLDWDDAAPGFYIEALAPEEDRVRRQLTKRHVVYAGSHEGCGCGFRRRARDLLRAAPGSAHLGASEPSRRSLEQLRRYLQREVTRVGPIELLACRDGDQARRPAVHRALRPSALADETFAFFDSELAVVTNAEP